MKHSTYLFNMISQRGVHWRAMFQAPTGLVAAQPAVRKLNYAFRLKTSVLLLRGEKPRRQLF